MFFLLLIQGSCELKLSISHPTQETPTYYTFKHLIVDICSHLQVNIESIMYSRCWMTDIVYHQLARLAAGLWFDCVVWISLLYFEFFFFCSSWNLIILKFLYLWPRSRFSKTIGRCEIFRTSSSWHVLFNTKHHTGYLNHPENTFLKRNPLFYCF